jgi:transcriptional regulator with XRE-family HTH domain
LELAEIVGKHIRKEILEQFQNVQEFLDYTGIAKGTLSEVLNGKNDIRLPTLAKICAGLGYSMSDLLNDPTIEAWTKEYAKKYPFQKKALKMTRLIRKPKNDE